VEGWHRQKGWPDPAPAGFWLRAYCPSGCEVAIAAGGVELGRLPLQPGRILENETIRAAIDEAVVESVLPRQDRLDTRRLAILDRIILAYRAVTPALCVLAFLAWLVALALHRRWQSPTLWLLATGAGVGAATRIVLLAVVDAMAFPGINPVYLSAAYPLLLLFIPLALAAGAASLGGAVARKEAPGDGGEPPASRP
jgi:hypothetical protein